MENILIYGIGIFSVGLYLTCRELEIDRGSFFFFDDWRLWIFLTILILGIIIIIVSLLS